MNIWIVIPAYNEEKNLGKLLDELKGKLLPVLVVDDGSTDNTVEVAKKNGVLLIRNPLNLGKGAALKTAIDFLLEQDNFDYIITMDADGQHSPVNIEDFLAQAGKGEDFVIGNRMGNPIGMSKTRLLTNKFMSWLISKIARQNITDTQCGFRLIKRDVLEKIEIKSDKFQAESEMIIKVSRNGIRIKSIPIKSIYFPGRRSKINPIMDTIRFVRFIWKARKNYLKAGRFYPV